MTKVKLPSGYLVEPVQVRRVHLWDSYKGGGVDEATLRMAAVELASYATGFGTAGGRSAGDNVFDIVTQGRAAQESNFSSCGELPHWMLMMLGCRDERLVNRDDDGGERAWQRGMNLTMIVYRARHAWRNMAMGVRPKKGDVLYVAKPGLDGKIPPRTEHVSVYSHVSEDTIVSYDYGQVLDGKQNGRKCSRTYRETATKITIGDRTLLGWLDISALDYDEPALIPDECSFQGGVLTDNPYFEELPPQYELVT